jgi:hypothetical protein
MLSFLTAGSCKESQFILREVCELVLSQSGYPATQTGLIRCYLEFYFRQLYAKRDVFTPPLYRSAILSRVWETLHWIWICNLTYWTYIQRVTTLHNSLLHKLQCSGFQVSSAGRWPSCGIPKCPRPSATATPNKVTNSIVEVEVNLRSTVSWSVCLGVGFPSGAHNQIFFLSLTIAGFLMWGALSDERMGL